MKKLILSLVLFAAILAPAIGGFASAFGAVALAAVLTPTMGGVAFTGIAIQDARAVFTNTLIAMYKERPQVTSFLRSFFPTEVVSTKEVSIEVMRGSEKVAVDVAVYSDGNRNSANLSTMKTFVPPLYHEYISANEHKLYEVVMGALMSGNTTFFQEMTNDMMADLIAVRDKIERAIEVQCSQVLKTGQVVLTNNTDIDFKRKAESMVAYNVANDFSVATVDPRSVLKDGCVFLRTKGKISGNVVNGLFGGEAFEEMTSNPKFQAAGDIKDVDWMTIREPQRNALGGVFHGKISCGSYIVNVWTYPEYYDYKGNSTPYLNEKDVVLLAETPGFKTAFAMVPQVMGGSTPPMAGQYIMQEEVNEVKGIHAIHQKSKPLVVPVKIDQIFTITVLS